MDLKKPLTFDEQLDKLAAYGMIITDREKAKDILKRVNYYRFTGYALQFRQDPSGSDYIAGTTFETVYHLYKVDEILRDIFRRYIEKAEVYYRTQIAYGFSIAKCTETPYDQHYDENNFYNKKGYREVMENFSREKNYYKDSLIVKHHKMKYFSKMPLWVIVELMSFSNMSKLYSSMYYSEKNAIASMVGVGKDTLENHLHCLSVLRNKCAHAASFQVKGAIKEPDQLQRTSKREYVIEPTKTNAGTRVIPMTNEVTEMFRAIIEDRPDYKVEKVVDGYTGFLFLDKDGMPLVAMHWEHRFNHMVSRYNEIYKVQMPNITPHVCRHTYCSNMAKSGMNPKTLQYLMGHSDIAVTLNVYTHVGLEDAEKELQKMQGLENARKEMGISDTDDKPLKQNMFKVV